MSGTYQTPGVYIVEKNAFPNSVVEVATAVPALIGYTEKADDKGHSLHNKPWRISTMSEFIHFFGGAPKDQYTIENFHHADKNISNLEGSDFNLGDDAFQLRHTTPRFFLYYSMMLFFQNGGGACYVVSVGNYAANAIEKFALESAFDALLKEQEPTMVIIPDAMSLSENDCFALQQASLLHCGFHMKNRFSILDIYGGYKDRYTNGDCVAKFRNALGANYLDFAATYYPWLNTSIVQLGELNFNNIANIIATDKNETCLIKLLKAEINQSDLSDEKKDDYNTIVDSIPSDLKENTKPISDTIKIHKTLLAISPLYKKILVTLQKKLNLLPPAAAMAGIYTMVDNSRGVWKAPANVSLHSVDSPSINITNEEQEDLNISTGGKSINAIRTFIGEGTLVWGARTLDGNSLDWRYINVRRNMIMLEESIRLATKAYVFEPNVANTWITIKSMINNFLADLWKRGGLAGANSEDAFSVHVGLGETMTPEDILEGILRVTVLVAVSRPAEFIEITFQQQMQKS